MTQQTEAVTSDDVKSEALNAIKSLIKAAKSANESKDAMTYSQAAQNITHVHFNLCEIEILQKREDAEVK